jgi:hypothetical protein
MRKFRSNARPLILTEKNVQKEYIDEQKYPRVEYV